MRYNVCGMPFSFYFQLGLRAFTAATSPRPDTNYMARQKENVEDDLFDYICSLSHHYYTPSGNFKLIIPQYSLNGRNFSPPAPLPRITQSTLSLRDEDLRKAERRQAKDLIFLSRRATLSFYLRYNLCRSYAAQDRVTPSIARACLKYFSCQKLFLPHGPRRLTAKHEKSEQLMRAFQEKHEIALDGGNSKGFSRPSRMPPSCRRRFSSVAAGRDISLILIITLARCGCSVRQELRLMISRRGVFRAMPMNYGVLYFHAIEE